MPSRSYDGQTEPVDLIEPLGRPGSTHTVAIGASSAEQALSPGCMRVSLTAVGSAAAFRVGSGSQTAVVTDHYLPDGLPKDFAVDRGSTLAVIGIGGTGTLYVSELT